MERKKSDESGVSHMTRKFLFCLVLLLLLLISSALCEGRDITDRAVFSADPPGSLSRLTDGDYTTAWQSGRGKKAYLEITLPGDTPCGTVYIQWYDKPLPFRIRILKDGEWVDLCRKTESYYNAARALPFPQIRFRICPLEDHDGSMSVAEIRLYAPGKVPDTVQFWEPTVEKADLMLLSCHPDDEVLWFGGALPTYAGQRQKKVLVCLLVPCRPCRRCEFLDALWTCGVRTYPVFGNQPDMYSTSLRQQYEMWSEKKLLKTVTLWYRRYRPEVVLTHDIRGEYGHGGHRVCADLCIRALKTAADADYSPETAAEWGTWNVKKLYLHLYDGGALEMPWDEPLEFFGGRTGLEVAREAFRCHISQQSTHYAVKNEGSNSCTRFGLYRSLVGEDEQKNDFFEHLGPGYNPFEVTE